jgi:hypothetical protein
MPNFSRKTARRKRKSARAFVPKLLQVHVAGSLRFDDPHGGRVKRVGRPPGTLDADTETRIQQFTVLLATHETPSEIRRKLFADSDEKRAGARMRSFRHRYRREIDAQLQILRGHFVRQFADSLQERLQTKAGRPRGLMLKTKVRLVKAALFRLGGQNKSRMSPKLFPGLPNTTARNRTYNFFTRHEALISTIQCRFENATKCLPR